MTMSPGEIERKVRQLDSDVQSVYEMLASISAQQSRQLNRLDALDAKIDTKVDGLDGHLDGIDSRFDGIDSRLDGLTSSMAEVLRRLPE